MPTLSHVGEKALGRENKMCRGGPSTTIKRATFIFVASVFTRKKRTYETEEILFLKDTRVSVKNCNWLRDE